METTDIIRSQETILESATQPLVEKIEEVGRQIQDSLMDGAVDEATEAIRNLSTWFEDTIWEAYLTSLLQCEAILVWLRDLGAEKPFVLFHTRRFGSRFPRERRFESKVRSSLRPPRSGGGKSAARKTEGSICFSRLWGLSTR